MYTWYEPFANSLNKLNYYIKFIAGKMKKILIIALLLISCRGSETNKVETEYKQVYYDCYHLSQDIFKKISRIDYRGLKVEDMCDEDTSFLDKEQDEICIKACRDAFNHYK